MAETHKSHDEKIQRLDELLRSIGTGMFTTIDDANGKLYSRPMTLRGGLDRDGKGGTNLYFFAYRGSEKVFDIRDDAHVNVAFADANKHYASVSGLAELTMDRGKMEEKWSEELRAWFPDGLDTNGICLIRVKVDDAQYWDAPNQTAIHLWGMLKAAVTGEGVKDAGENEKVSM